MALQQVNVGTIPNDGTGDDPRTGISKVNSNMSLLESTGVNGVDNVFTEANLNPNIFGNTVANDWIVVGEVAASGTVAVFTLPISGLVQATGAAFTGTFGVTDVDSAASYASGLVSLATASISGNKLLVLTATVAGAAPNQGVRLIIETNSSQIEVTF